jgi:hypothetical protein
MQIGLPGGTFYIHRPEAGPTRTAFRPVDTGFN